MKHSKNGPIAEYGGRCAFAVSLGKFDVEGGDSQLEKNGKQYAFSNGIAKMLFWLIPNRRPTADKHWQAFQTATPDKEVTS